MIDRAKEENLTPLPEDFFKFKNPWTIKLLKEKSEVSKKEFYKLNYNPIYLKSAQFQNGTLKLVPETEITADNIAQFALPIVEYIAQTNPDYIIALDRGARLLGFAVHVLYQELGGKLPTKNHSILFRRVSKSVPYEQTADYLKPDIEEMLQETPSPNVLILDDWIHSGKTRDTVNRIFDEQTDGRANITYGVLAGPGADISGDSDAGGNISWLGGRGDLLGVDYNDTQVLKNLSPEAIAFRQRIVGGIKSFAHDLKKQQRQNGFKP